NVPYFSPYIKYDINAVAKPKYINILIMSLIVVINGPLATAGSIFILFINIGMIAPINVPTVIAIVRLMETINAKTGSLYNKIIIRNKLSAQQKPVNKPEPDSRKASLNLLCSSISPVDILRTETAKDCVPELPLIPLIIGIKAANKAT